MNRVVFCLLILSVLVPSAVYGQAGGSDEAGLHENLGQNVPLDLVFRDESGSPVKLGDIIDRPAVLTLVYYHCSHICPQMLFGISNVLAKINLVPGRDYRLITLSFDETDTPDDARAQKVNYLKAISGNFSETAWKFLTGGRDDIKRISQAAGIKYRPVMHGFVHPEVLVFLSPHGKITGYMHVSTSSYGVQYPVVFSPVEFAGAIAAASKGNIGNHVTKTPLLCFPHEPEQQAKFYRMLSIFGGITLLIMIALFSYLSVANRKIRGRR